MRGPALSALTLTLLIGAAACDPDRIASPRNSGPEVVPAPSLPTGSANLSCSYSPSGSVGVPIGATQTFIPSNVSDCAGAWGTLTPADGRVGFGVGACTVFEPQEGGSANLFKVRRCTAGNAQFKIYTNSSKTTLLQTIEITINP